MPVYSSTSALSKIDPNQSRRDRVARDTIGLHPVPQLGGEFCLPRLSIVSASRSSRKITALI
jgi:hypothetical protein